MRNGPARERNTGMSLAEPCCPITGGRTISFECKGFVDVADATVIVGWAETPDARCQPLFVDPFDGEMVQTRLAHGRLPEGSRGGRVGDGCHGFQHSSGEILRCACRYDMGDIFWYVPHGARSSFVFTIDCAAHNFGQTDVLYRLC